MTNQRFEVYARIVAVALLAIGCFYVLRPFLGAIIFAGILVLLDVADLRAPPAQVRGPLLAHRARRGAGTGRRPGGAGGPFGADRSWRTRPTSSRLFRGFLDRKESFELPAFITNIPMLGPWLDEYTHALVLGEGELASLIRRFSEPAKDFMVAIGHGIAAGLVQVLLALFVAFFLYRDGEQVRKLLLGMVTRLAGTERGGALLATAQSAVRGVVYGLIGTALVQAVVAFLGFVIAGVPGAFLLGALTFILSLVPMGPVIIWGGAAAWLHFHGEDGWAIFMVVYGIVVISSVDNFVKPILMSRAGNLSMLLVVLGVFGGAVAFGFIGLFVGPALLALAWNIFKTWLELPDLDPEDSPAK